MNISLMQRVLGEDWTALPPVIQRHYQLTAPQQAITVTGSMNVDYPNWLAPAIKLLRVFGTLVDLKGEGLAVQVKKMATNRPFRTVLATAYSGSRQRQTLRVRITHGLATGS